MPQEEETAHDKTRVEETGSALSCDVYDGQCQPQELLQKQNLDNKINIDNIGYGEAMFFRNRTCNNHEIIYAAV